MLHSIEIYFLLFMTYSIIGWCMEVTCKLIQYKKFINRGFLMGPYCPIYGWGAIAITLLLKKYIDDPLALFLFGMVVCSIIEYFTSYFMEKVYHARWWDYSQKKFNINGRVCLNTMVPFGLLGMFISYLSNPLFIGIYENLSPVTLNIICGTLEMIFLIDNIISGKIISSVRVEGKKLEKDNTEEITKKVKEILMNRNWAYKRLFNAYPELKEIGDILKQNVERVKEVTYANIEKAKEDMGKVKEVSKENLKRAKRFIRRK